MPNKNFTVVGLLKSVCAVLVTHNKNERPKRFILGYQLDNFKFQLSVFIRDLLIIKKALYIKQLRPKLNSGLMASRDLELL